MPMIFSLAEAEIIRIYKDCEEGITIVQIRSDS